MIQRFFKKASTAPETTVADIPANYAETGVQFVDVREPEEWQTVRMPESVHIPLDQLALRASELDPKRPVVTVCRSGLRSLDAGDVLIAAGFSDVKSLAGGLIAWSQAGRPLQR